MLALGLAKYHDELYADFQQYYGIDLWQMDTVNDGYDVRRAAILAAQLPIDARVHVAIDPRASVTLTDVLLRQIELNQRSFAYSFSKDAKNGSNAPESIELPGESEAREKAAQKAVDTSKSVADAFGLKGLGAVR